MKRLVYIKPMSHDKRFTIVTRRTLKQERWTCYGETKTIERVEYLRREGYEILHIADDLNMVYIVCEVI